MLTGNSLYQAFNDEIIEDKDLFVAGETPVDEDEGDIPVRILQDFSIYNMETSELVSVAELLGLQFSRSTFGSSGMVRPWIDDSDDRSNESDSPSNSSEDGDYVTLSKILELNIHDLSDDGKELDRSEIISSLHFSPASLMIKSPVKYIYALNLLGTS